MCRHAAYIGPGASLTEIMWDLPHSLMHQAYQARELLTGVVCADGFGVGWYEPDVRDEPGRYVSPMPVWSDVSLPSFGPLVRSHIVVGAVRNATKAGENHAGNCAPFQSGKVLLSHNGALEDFDAWKEMLADRIAPEHRAVATETDSSWLFALLLTRMDEAPLPQAMQETIRDVLTAAREAGLEAQLNLLVSDGHHVVATRAGTRPTQNSLYLLQDGDEFPGAMVVASEPLYDDPAWTPVDPDTVLVLQAGAPPVRLSAQPL